MTDPEPQQYNMNYCMYCWREAENTIKGNPDEGKIPVCAYHMIGFAAEKSEDTFAQRMGYKSAKEVERQYENQEEPKITISKAIGIINHHTDPRGSGFNDKDPVVYTEEIREQLAKKAQNIVGGSQ